jgi:O-antigen ligase
VADAPIQGQRHGARVATQARSTGLRLVHALWILTVFEVDVFLSAKTGGPFYLLPTLLAPILIILTAANARKGVLYWPMVLFLGMHLLASVIAPNAGLARPHTKFMVYMTLLFASSVCFVNVVPKMSTILKLYMLGFLWFGVQGIPRGLVPWHYLLANEDSFGPLMVLAMPIGFFFASAATSARWRWLGHGLFAVSIVGLISSFARGASLAGAAVLLYIFVLSPNKGRTLLYLGVAAAVLIPLVAMLIPLDAYFKEVASSAGGDEGRMQIWSMAWRVFKSSPIWGVGAGNYGVGASRVATPEELDAMWHGYYFLAVHNTAIEILSEEGLIGITLWVTMIVHFFSWTRRLRTQAAREVWVEQGGDFDLRLLSRGLDGSMIGYLLSGIFYNQLYIHWFWTLLLVAYLLKRLSTPMGAVVERRRAGWRVAPQPLPRHA